MILSELKLTNLHLLKTVRFTKSTKIDDREYCWNQTMYNVYRRKQKTKFKKSRCIVQYLPLNSGYISIRLLQPFTGWCSSLHHMHPIKGRWIQLVQACSLIYFHINVSKEHLFTCGWDKWNWGHFKKTTVLSWNQQIFLTECHRLDLYCFSHIKHH